MKYITAIERRAEERGLEQGLEQGLYESITDILTVRFASTPQTIIEQVAQVEDHDTLRALRRQALLAPSLAAFEGVLAQMIQGVEPGDD